ncbi:MAG: hypothetical protein PGN37_24055 [Mycobacterium kyogaense]|uniref:hypothetical protein n=1 Tax=Mycobacterium kyogaense TaxID=2212479 RepID=UPI002FFA7DE5
MGFVGASIADAVTGHRIVRVGGCASGALGNLAENRTLAKAAAREIVTHLESSSGRAGLAGLGESVSLATTFADWTVLDRAETMRARPNRVRTKFTSWPAAAQAVVEYRRRTATAPHPLSQNP